MAGLPPKHLRRMIARAFPELRRLRIAIAFQPLPAGVLFQYEWDRGRYSIAVSEELRRAPLRVIEGGIAHELAHLARDRGLPPRALDESFDRYERSRFSRIRDERATDDLACDRGFAPQLLALVRYGRAHGIRFHGEHGLHGREIAARCRPPRRSA